MRVYVIHQAPGDTLGNAHMRNAVRRSSWWRGGAGVIIEITPEWSMDRICRRVNERGSEGVGVLYLLSHGNVGSVQLGQGLTAANAGSFQLLRGRWVGQHPRIEVHGCLVASTTPTVGQPAAGVTPAEAAAGACATRGRSAITGQSMCYSAGTRGANAPGHQIMQALANAAGVLVVAGVNVQLTDSDFQFEGPISHYYPIVYYHRPPGAVRRGPPQPYNLFA